MIPKEKIKLFRENIPGLKVLVIGDLMLDRYLWGTVSRISPEAPVPIVDVQKSESRPGGAANVALNIASLGATVALCGVIGNDDEGVILKNHLLTNKFDCSLLFTDNERNTTTKTRVIGNNQQILRVDKENRDPITASLTQTMIQRIRDKIPFYDVIIFEDYDKGVLSDDFIHAVVEMANKSNVPTVVDPKFRNFLSYEGVTLFKPNLNELNEAFATKHEKTDTDGIIGTVGELRSKMPHKYTLITLSEQGAIAVNGEGEASHLAAHVRKVKDVSGAGDTVIAVIALGLAAGLTLEEAAVVANLAGGLVCEEVGVVPVSHERLFSELES